MSVVSLAGVNGWDSAAMSEWVEVVASEPKSAYLTE